jgi:hypothetical protein
VQAKTPEATLGQLLAEMRAMVKFATRERIALVQYPCCDAAAIIVSNRA